MSYAEIGSPVGAESRTRSNGRIFSHIPRLHELLKAPPGGWPGVTYAQVCVHNMKRATDRTERPANLRPIHGVDFFTIRGPKGDVSMALMGTGVRIKSASPQGGARLFFTDGDVESLTGLVIEEHGVDPIWFSPAPEADDETPVTRPRRGRPPKEVANV